LEIGPGHNPFAGVTHLLERNVADGRERGGHALLVPAAAHLIVGEATVLPFAAGSFDFVYASHVLEHVDDPEAACREIMRVAAAGYIETPSPFLEQGLALKDETSPDHWFHRWSEHSVPARTDNSSGNFMSRWTSVKPSIFFDGPRKPPCSTGRGLFRWRRAITWLIAGKNEGHAASSG
jgi:SAM-dependent methyltransferase